MIKKITKHLINKFKGFTEKSGRKYANRTVPYFQPNSVRFAASPPIFEPRGRAGATRRMAAARRRLPKASLLFLLCCSSVLLFCLRLSSSSSSSSSSRDDLSTCLAVYDEGGAPAVFESPKCPRWTLTDESEGLGSSAVRRTPRCQPAVMQGRRRHLEDRAVCALDIRIPFPGKSPIVQICLIVGVVRLDDVAFE